MAERPYQHHGRMQVYEYWDAGARVVCLVMPTGSGKTFVFSLIAQEEPGECCIMAHRQELASQISLSLAGLGVYHRILGPKNAVKTITALHHQAFGRSFVNPGSSVTVAGVKTLNSRANQLQDWGRRQRLWIMDEGHHLLRENEWGKAVELMPNARGLPVTATPCRADGKGLGRHADGLMDALVEPVTARELIDDGYLTDYRIMCPPNDLDLSGVEVTRTGDYSHKQLKAAVKNSKLTGDVVDHYVRNCHGMLGITFSSDIESAELEVQHFRSRGVPAELVTAKTGDRERANILERFRNRELLQLVNVDLFGEGFDVPAIQSDHFARPTESYSLYSQQFGRALRPIYAPGYDLSTREGRLAAIANSEKPRATILDHVGNVVRHKGPPDFPRQWTLDRREKKNSGKTTIGVKTCTNPECMAPYEAFKPACPFCGMAPEPAQASTGVERVDGDLEEMPPDVLAQLRQEVERVDAPAMVPGHLRGTPAERAIHKRHAERQEWQTKLRREIAWWAGWMRSRGLERQEIYRAFWLKFGMDVMSAKALGKPDALKLIGRIWEDYIDDAI